MLKVLQIIFCLGFLTACGQTSPTLEIKGVVIDPAIRNEANKQMSELEEMDSIQNTMSIYANAMWVKTYESDTLAFADTSFSNKQLFKSFYLWRGDTLVLHGVFGLFGGSGFAIHLRKDGATLYHLVNADASNVFGYQPNDTLTDILNVPCVNTKMVLSELPDSNKKQEVYGYVAFESASYYQATMADGKEQLPRSKQRVAMRVYFKSSFLKL
jgi:hypothetical protein